MNIASAHEISQVNCLNFNSYTIVECDPWQKDRIFMLDMRSLSKSPKVALNFSKNTSKLLNKDDWCSNKGVNQAKVVPDNRVFMNPTWVRPVGYWWGWNQMIKCIWLIKPWNFEHVPSNLSSKLIHGSFGWGFVAKTHHKEIEIW